MYIAIATPPPGASNTLKADGQRARPVEDEVGGLVLVTEGVTADDDGLVPAGHQTRDIGDDDRLAEDRAAEDVADGAVGRFPHLLEAEFFDPRLIRCDGGALDTDAVLLDGVRRVDRHPVVGGVAMFDAQVVVVEVDVEVRQQKVVLDGVPDDAGHFVAVDFNDRSRYLDL